jgi:hypothetical protein
MSRLRSFLAYLVILAGAVVGLANVAWFVVPPGTVLLLWISDRGQHRWLVEKFPSVSPVYILILSIGGSLLNNAGAMAAAWALGRVVAWVWGI